MRLRGVLSVAKGDEVRAVGRGEPEVLDLAWPDGMPAEEHALLVTLDTDRRAIVVRRLAALLDVERGLVDLTGGAREAGVARTLFYNLRKAWRLRRSLRSLVPYAKGPNPAPSFVEPHKREGLIARRQATERAAAVAAIRADPAASSDEIASRIAEETGSELDRRTLVSLARQERRLLHFSPHLLRGVYGRSVLADVSALALLVESGGQAETAIAAMIVERSTGLVLGHAVGRRRDGAVLQVSAASRAITFLYERGLDVPADVVVGMMLVVPPGTGARIDRLIERGVAALGSDAVIEKGRLRFGRRLAALIGQPGSIGLRTMSTVPRRNVTAPEQPLRQAVLSVGEADALLGAELLRHNRSALDALRLAGFGREGASAGAMARLIAAVFDVPQFKDGHVPA